jgi:hypothetical protein
MPRKTYEVRLSRKEPIIHEKDGWVRIPNLQVEYKVDGKPLNEPCYDREPGSMLIDLCRAHMVDENKREVTGKLELDDN